MRMVNSKSRLTIGLPVFNGEAYLRDAVDSLLAQSYNDFKLILSDNASTDATQEICLDYARKDDRVSYYRNRRNLGIAWNYNRVFYLSSSEYFKWAAHDDIHHPEYLRKCIQVLDDDESIVLCHTKNNRIDENGKLTGNYDDRTLSSILSSKPHERFADLISQKNPCWSIFGVLRSASLRKTRLNGSYINSDRNLLAEIGLVGRMFEIPEHLFFRRDHSKSYTDNWLKVTRVRDYRSQTMCWTSDGKRPFIVLPNWNICIEYLKSVLHANLSLSESLLCYKEIAKWVLREAWPLMKWDLTNELDLWRLRLNNKQTRKNDR